MYAYLEISNQYSAISVETSKSDDVTIHIADRVSNTGNGITLTAEQAKLLADMLYGVAVRDI